MRACPPLHFASQLALCTTRMKCGAKPEKITKPWKNKAAHITYIGKKKTSFTRKKMGWKRKRESLAWLSDQIYGHGRGRNPVVLLHVQFPETQIRNCHVSFSCRSQSSSQGTRRWAARGSVRSAGTAPALGYVNRSWNWSPESSSPCTMDIRFKIKI